MTDTKNMIGCFFIEKGRSAAAKLILAMMLLLPLWRGADARPAYPWPVTVAQPDGTKIQIRIHGDEFGHYMTDLSGHAVTRSSDGTICYASQKDGNKELTVGASEMEPGMTLTFRRLCHGDSAVLILPPHFAKGLIGDMDRIPPHSVVVYFVRIND